MAAAAYREICISPPVGAPLAGFAAREGVSTGVHDDLYARALVLEHNRRAAIFVSVDVLALDAAFVRQVRASITRRTGVPAPAIMISSTHTHAGPVTVATFFNPGATLDGEYMTRLAGAIEAAATEAWERRRPALVGVGSGRVSGIGVNRRTADMRPLDEQIGILKVEIEDGARGALVNHTCHPTVLGPDNLLITGDYPAFAIQRIRERLEGGFALFVNGAQGNISMGHSSELSAIGVITPGRTFERARELGFQLADAVLEALPGIAVGSRPVIAAVSDTLDLPWKPYPPVAETARKLAEAEASLDRLARDGAPSPEIARARTRRLYASIDHFYAGERQVMAEARLPIEIQAIRIDDSLFVGAPAEIFVEIGLRLKAETAHPLYVMGITNGYIGYLPTRAAYAQGGYEVVSAKCAEAAEDLFVAKVRELDARLFGRAEAA